MSKMLCFSHLPKAAGTSVISQLRSTFGVGHIDVISGEVSRGGLQLARRHDLARALKLHPKPRSLAGHGLRPFINYGEIESGLIWTFLARDPVARVRSKFMYQSIRYGLNISFSSWAKEFLRPNEIVEHLAGSPEDLDGALDMINNKIQVLGVVEDMTGFFANISSEFNGFHLRTPILFSVASNRSSEISKRRFIEKLPRRREDYIEYTELDDVIYNRILSHVNRGSSGEVSTEGNIKQVPSLVADINVASNRLWRNIVYKPCCKFDSYFKNPR